MFIWKGGIFIEKGMRGEMLVIGIMWGFVLSIILMCNYVARAVLGGGWGCLPPADAGGY